MSIQAYIQQRMQAGVMSAREIHAEIVRPSTVTTTGKEARPTANLEAEFKALVVPAIMNNAAWNAALPAERDEIIEARLINRMGAPDLTTDGFVSLAKLQAQMNALRRKIERRGGDATGPDSNKAERDTITTTEGPALWQTWGIEKPTVKQVRELMQ